MTLVGIPLEQQDACFRLVAAVLHMGNLEFAEGSEQDSSQLAPVAAKHLDACAMLLGVAPEGLLKALTTRTRQTVDGQWLQHEEHFWTLQMSACTRQIVFHP